MIQGWQRKLLIREDEYAEYLTAGNFSRVLKAGKTYKITAIGGAAGSLICRMRKANWLYRANGGIGGTIQIQIQINEDVPIQFTVGAGGLSKAFQFSSAGLQGVGLPGENTVITFPNGQIIAGLGSAPSVSATSDTVAATTVGVMGQNTMTVPNAQILINNPNNIISWQDNYSFSEYRDKGIQPNTNWPKNTNVGAAAICGNSTTAFLLPPSNAGGVIIETVF